MNKWTSPDGAIRLYLGDAMEILPTLPAPEAILTDPPYGLGARMHDGRGDAWRKHWDTPAEWDTAPVDPDFVRSLADMGECVIWGGNYYPLPPTRGWLAWDKDQEHTSGHFEMAWTNLDMPTRMFKLSRIEAYWRGKSHPTEKPVRLMEWCLSFLSAKRICDPFMGSGSTALACIRHGKEFDGIEKDAWTFDMAVCRVQQEYKRTAIFDAPEKQNALF